MPRTRTWALFAIALGLRLLISGWDAAVPATSLHPDERQVAFVTEKMDGWLSDPGFFAYGSLHFQAILKVATVLGIDDSMRGLIVGGRLLSVAASMLALFLGWAMARRAWGRRTADLFLLVAAFVPLDLQQSHFATVEAHHTAWIIIALAACFWLATGGGGRAAAAAGAAVGASLAVKVASLALGLPLGLALVLAARSRGLVDLIRMTAVAAGAGLATFWLCQPFAFVGGGPPWPVIIAPVLAALLLEIAARRPDGPRRALVAVAIAALAFTALQGAALTGIAGDGPVGQRIASTRIGPAVNPAYLAGVGEQVRMVMGEADLPYVRVFVNTLPVLYPLRELALWGWGPLLVLAVLAAVVFGGRLLGRRWRRLVAGRWSPSAILLLLLLAWLVPMTVRLSTLYVKYLRYWEPLVVPAVLVTVWWLSRLPAGLRRRATLTVVAGTVLWGLGYMWAFVDPHPHGTASRWLTPMLEPGQVIAFESWDETIGLHPDDGPVEVFSLPSYDLPDDEAKVERWLSALERADWVVLTSNRVVRTILANPRRFPLTGRLYRLLLSGEAGFEVLARASRGPRIFGLRWPVQLADESFVNYEFPQVLILRRTGPVPVDELASRVARPLPFASDAGLAGLQRRLEREVPVITPVPTRGRQLADTVQWSAVFVLLAGAAWVMLLPLTRGWSDAGVGLAAATGWIVPAWLMWIGNELRLWPTDPSTATWIVLAALLAGVLVATRRWDELVHTWERRRSAVLSVLGVAVGVGVLFLVVRAWNPAVHWGEKPMDFSFLNAFLRSDTWPTGEPWMAGMPLHYYYFGQILASFPILVTGCTAGVGYNLMAATIPALTAAVLAGFGLLLAGRRTRWAAAVLPALVLLTGNLAWPWLVEMGRQGKIFDMWWATSRVIPGFAIDEYPLWTAIFADLHGHFIALPVMVASLAWGWLCIHGRDRRWMVAAVMTGICVAVLVATNPWDIFILSGALGVGVLMAARRPLTGMARLVVAAAVSLVAAGPFIVELVAGLSAGAGSRGLFLTAQDFAPWWAVLRHFGLFLIPLAVLAVMVAAGLGLRGLAVVPFAGLGMVVGLSFGSTAAALSMAAAGVFAIPALLDRDRWARLAWSLAGLGALAVAACERFTLIDRMNTIFKVYNGVWLLLAAALAMLVFRTGGRRRRILLAVWLPLQLIASVNLPLGIAQGWLQPRKESPRPSLDGQAFLAGEDPETWFLSRALQAAMPHETVAESAGISYAQNTRIAMHTGQPTVVGWEWHLVQRGQSVDEIKARFADLEVLYSGRDPLARRAVLDRYRVGWAVLGGVERSNYGLDPDATLADIPGVVKIAEAGGAALYRVLPRAGGDPPVVAQPSVTLPAGVRAVGRLPQPEQSAVRSLHLDDEGAIAVLPDGRMVMLDQAFQELGDARRSECEAASAVRSAGVVWVLCEDGRLARFRGAGWQPAGRVANARSLAADEAVWAWGEGGLWKLDGGSPRLVAPGPVTAAAATGAFVAWSDGSRTWIGAADDRPHEIGSQLDGIRALGWQGSMLWALGRDGLYRSGGGLLPWRRVFDEIGPIDMIAGDIDRLWIVLPDGTVLEEPAAACPPPWAPSSGATTSGLAQPRGLALSPDGWLAVVDTMNHRVRWYSGSGVCLDESGSRGSADGSFHEPSGLALADDGRLAVADTWNGRIQILAPGGEIETAGDSLFGPRGVVWDVDGSLLVADTGNRRLLRLTPPTWEQSVVVELTAPVVGLAWVGDLLAVATPAAGTLALVDPGSGSIARTLEVPGWSNLEQQEGYLVVLPSGELAASAPQPGEIWAVDPTGSNPPRLLRGRLPGVTAMVVRPDGMLVASLTWDHRLIRVDLGD
jgi:YYY domain-containing protein